MGTKGNPIPRGRRPDGSLMSQEETNFAWALKEEKRGATQERQQRAAARSSTRAPGHGAAAQLTENLVARHGMANNRARIAERLFPPRARPKNKAPERP
jgi:hypothetical protein